MKKCRHERRAGVGAEARERARKLCAERSFSAFGFGQKRNNFLQVEGKNSLFSSTLRFIESSRGKLKFE